MIHATPQQLATTALVLAERYGPQPAAHAVRVFLARSQRSHLLPLVLASLADLRRQQGWELETAYPVPAEVIQIAAQPASGGAVTVRINSALLGGFRLHAAGVTIDASLRNYLRQLRRHLEVAHA